MKTMTKDQYLLSIQEDISKMIHLSLDLLKESEDYFMNFHPEIMENILRADATMNAYELKIEKQGLELLALHAPEANDLRKVIGILRAVNDLERIGDLCCNIVRTTSGIEPHCCDLFGIDTLFHRVKNMLASAAESFLQGNIELAYYVLRQDQVVDDLNGKVFRDSVEQITKEPDRASICVHYLLISRYLERIGDHATNISESAIFIHQGTEVKHQNL
jgi:phosphate transport system protein